MNIVYVVKYDSFLEHNLLPGEYYQLEEGCDFHETGVGNIDRNWVDKIIVYAQTLTQGEKTGLLTRCAVVEWKYLSNTKEECAEELL